MINVINKNKYIHAAIVLLLIVCIIVSAATPARAELVLTTGIIAVVGTILIASGMSFDSDASMTAAVQNFWGSIDSDTKTAIAAIADQYTDFLTGNPLKKFVFKISRSVVSAVVGWLQGLGVSGSSTSVSVPTGTDVVIDTSVMTEANVFNYYYPDDPTPSNDDLQKIGYRVPGVPFVLCGLNSHYISPSLTIFLVDSFGKRLWGLSTASGGKGDDWGFGLMRLAFSYDAATHYWTVTRSHTDPSDDWSDSTVFTVPVDWDGSVSIPLAPDYIPAGSGSKPLDSDCDIVLPSGLVKTGSGTDTIDSDLVGTMTPDSVRDTSTDVDVPDTGILSGIRDLVGDIAGAITGTLSDLLTGIKTGIDSIATTLGNFFDVSQFELDFSPFQIGLTKIFPFCIPFDFYSGIKIFAQQAASDFSFDIKLDTDYFKIDHSVDLSNFKIPFAFFRFVAVFWFSYILISRTRDFMKW